MLVLLKSKKKRNWTKIPNIQIRKKKCSFVGKTFLFSIQFHSSFYNFRKVYSKFHGLCFKV